MVIAIDLGEVVIVFSASRDPAVFLPQPRGSTIEAQVDHYCASHFPGERVSWGDQDALREDVASELILSGRISR